MLEESGNCMERGGGKRKKRNFNTENRDGGLKSGMHVPMTERGK